VTRSVETREQSIVRRRPVQVALTSLVVATLLGSVAVPAFETRRIMRLLDEITQLIEPARLHSWRLESGIAMEYSALQGYALSGDSAQLRRYRSTTDADARELASLQHLAPRHGAEAVQDLATVQRRITEWQALNRGLFDGTLSREQFKAAALSQRALRDSIIEEIDLLPSQLSAAAATRRAELRAHEQRSLFVNAALVCVALASVAAVVVLGRRERRLAAILQYRVDEESALRHMARALSEAVTIDDAMQRIVEGTMATTRQLGAYVEFAPSDHSAIRAAAQMDGGAPGLLSERLTRAGSLTEDAMARAHSRRVTQIDAIERWLPADFPTTTRPCIGLMVPLLSYGEPIGVLVVLRDATSPSFSEDARRQLGLLGDLAATVLRRVEVERAALVAAEQRTTYEAALRNAAEALAAAFSLDDVTEQIARLALDATRARGAYVEHLATAEGSAVVVVRAVAGNGVPALQTTREYAGSLTERAILASGPLTVIDPNADGVTEASTSPGAVSSTIALPLGSEDARIGALFIVDAAPVRYAMDHTTWAFTFGHLAALAYEKVRLIEEAREGRRELERVMRSRQRLIRGFSHDVKNPLGAAEGYADLLSLGVFGQLSAEQQKSIARIRASIRTALDLIDELHELSRAETGNVALRRDTVDPGELARTIGEEYRGAAIASGLVLNVEVAHDTPSIATDGARVRQIVGNLLSNAIKYTSAGLVTLRVGAQRSVESQGADDWLRFDVIDTGLGIPADKRESIFEEFSRLDGNDKPGAGLGLAISERLARALGGSIVVDSEVGHGSTFTFRIPLLAPPDPVAAPHASSQSRRDTISAEASPAE